MKYDVEVEHLTDVVAQNALLVSQIEKQLRQWLKNYEADWRENQRKDVTVDLRRLAKDVLPCHYEIEDIGVIFERTPEVPLDSYEDQPCSSSW